MDLAIKSIMMRRERFMTTFMALSTFLNLSGTSLIPLIFRDLEELSNLDAWNMFFQVPLTLASNIVSELHTWPESTLKYLSKIILKATRKK